MSDKKQKQISVAHVVKNVELFDFFGIEATDYQGDKKFKFNSKFTFDMNNPKSVEEHRKCTAKANEACKLKWGPKYKQVMANPEFAHGLRDPETCIHLKDEYGEKKPKADELKGKIFFNAKANADKRPNYGIVVGGKLKQITDDKEIATHFYTGAIVIVSLSILPYKHGVKFGYSFWMDNIVLKDPGERKYGGTKSMNSAFNMEELLSEIGEVDEEIDESEFDESEFDFQDDIAF